MISIRPFFRAATACLVFACLLVGGCLKSDEKAVLAKDGTGTWKRKVIVDMAKMNELKEMLKSFGEMGGEGEGGGDKAENPLDDYDPEKIKKSLEGKEGVTLVSATKEEAADKSTITYNVEVKFQSLKALFDAGLVLGTPGTKITMQEKDGAWVFASAPAEGSAEEMAQAEGMAAMVGPILEGFEKVETLELPGTIVETNGKKSDAGNSVTWKIDKDNLFKPEAHKRSVTFKGEGLTLKAFEHTLKAEEPAEAGAEK